jgi:hypothetical protein
MDGVVAAQVKAGETDPVEEEEEEEEEGEGDEAGRGGPLAKHTRRKPCASFFRFFLPLEGSPQRRQRQVGRGASHTPRTCAGRLG